MTSSIEKGSRPRVFLRSGKFLALLSLPRLLGIWKYGERWWLEGYVTGLLLFYFQALLVFVFLLDRQWAMPRFLVHAGSFVVLALMASALLLFLGTEAAVLLGRLGLKFPWILDTGATLNRFPIIVWVLLLVPALPVYPKWRMAAYWGIVLFFAFSWSSIELARELARQGKSDVVYSLRNLGFLDGKIFRTHLLVGNCREFVVAHLFDLWNQLLLIELAMGFGVRYARTLTDSPDLLPYSTSFGYLLADKLKQVQEGNRPEPEVLFSALLLGTMFLSYWLVQVGALQLRQAGGIEYLEALKKRSEPSLRADDPDPGPTIQRRRPLMKRPRGSK